MDKLPLNRPLELFLKSFQSMKLWLTLGWNVVFLTYFLAFFLEQAVVMIMMYLFAFHWASDAWGCPDESSYQQCLTSEVNDSLANCGPILGTDVSLLTVRDNVCLSDIWCYPSQFEGPLQTDSSLTVPLLCLFTIHEVSPQWSFSSESTKVNNFLMPLLFFTSEFLKLHIVVHLC